MAADIKASAGIGVAVVGCGYWGVNYLRVLRELPQVGTVYAYDPRVLRLKEVVDRFPHVVPLASFDDVLGSPDISAAIVCTPATQHYEVAAPLLDAGKHLLVEKPITTTSNEATLLIEQAAAKDVTLAVGHTFVFNAGVQAVKHYVDNGNAGQVYYLYSRRTNLGPIRYDVNALWDLAPHDISIFNHLLGSDPAWVSAVGSRVLGSSREDVGFVSIGYANGVVAHIHVSWADPFKVRELVVVGSEQRIVFDDLDATEPVRIYEKGVAPGTEDVPTYGEYPLQIRDGDIISPKVEPSEPLKNQTMHFLDSVLRGTRPLTDGPAGRSVVQVMEAIDRSVALDGAPVPVGSGASENSRER
jgi:predicted dehydrogenase